MPACRSFSDESARAGARGREGAILVVVLVFIAFASSLLASAMRVASSGARASSVFVKAMRADELGRAAPELVGGWISANPDADRRGGAIAAHFSGADVFIDYVSESARIDVNASSPELLGAVFRAAGAGLNASSEIAERIALTRRPEMSGGGRLDHVAAIAGAWGVPQDMLDRAAPALTIANGTGKIDPTIASRLVIAALAGGEGLRVDDFLERRQRGFASEADAKAALAAERPLDVGFEPVPVYRALARVVIGRSFERRFEFVVAPPPTAGGPARTLSWRLVF